MAITMLPIIDPQMARRRVSRSPTVRAAPTRWANPEPWLMAGGSQIPSRRCSTALCQRRPCAPDRIVMKLANLRRDDQRIAVEA